ncbi:hypothetical protein ACJW30_02G192600 [Castanea mollissima]
MCLFVGLIDWCECDQRLGVVQVLTNWMVHTIIISKTIVDRIYYIWGFCFVFFRFSLCACLTNFQVLTRLFVRKQSKTDRAGQEKMEVEGPLLFSFDLLDSTPLL